MEAAVAQVQPEPPPRPPYKWLIALAVMLGTFLEVLDSSIVNVSLPHMQGSFSASVDEISWVLTSYLGALRPQALLPHFHVFISDCLGALRGRPLARPDGDLSPASGRRGRGHAPFLASHHDGDVSARGTTACDGYVGRRNDGRADPGTYAGRLDHGQLGLALEFLHQHPG